MDELFPRLLVLQFLIPSLKISLAIFPSFFFSKHFIHLPFVADNKAGITG